MEVFGIGRSGWPVAPGSGSSHHARHGLSWRAFTGGAATAVAGPTGQRVSVACRRIVYLKSERHDEHLWSARPREERDSRPLDPRTLHMVMQSSLRAVRSTAVKRRRVKGRRARSRR